MFASTLALQFVQVVLLMLQFIKVVFFMLQDGGELAAAASSSGGPRSILIPLLKLIL